MPFLGWSSAEPVNDSFLSPVYYNQLRREREKESFDAVMRRNVGVEWVIM